MQRGHEDREDQREPRAPCRAEEQGAKAVAMNPAELAALGAQERTTWERVIRVANIKAD